MRRIVVIGMVVVTMIGAYMYQARSGVAQVAVADDEMIVVPLTQGDEDKLVILHKPSKALLLYSNSSKGIVLQQVRTLKRDLDLAALVRSLDYKAGGYSVKAIEELLKK